MGNRTHYATEAMYSDVKTIYGHMTGNGVDDLVFVSGDVLTAVDTDVGDFNVTFRHKYPQGLFPEIEIVGTTEGLRGRFTAWNPAAGTGSITFFVGNTPTDPASTDAIYFRLDVRNSGANPDTI